MPKVSIILAIYNVENYLRECLNSLINQTLREIEIICVNDASTDNSLNILKEYQAKDDRIKIIDQENQGPGVARNKGLDIASGKYIMIVDSDDWLELDACEIAYNQIEKNGNDIVIFGYKKYYEKSDEYKEENHLKSFAGQINNPQIRVSELETNFFNNGYAWGKIYNRDFLQRNNIKFLPQYLCEDGPFILLSLALSNSISVINKPLYYYRVRDNSASADISRWKEYTYSREYVADFLIKHNIDKSIISKYIEYMFFSFYSKYNYVKRDLSVKKLFKKEMRSYQEKVCPYMNKKIKFLYVLNKFYITDTYYGFIRPLLKSYIVLPLRKVIQRKHHG